MSTPSAMAGRIHAKYRKNVVDIVLCNVFAPTKPAHAQSKMYE